MTRVKWKGPYVELKSLPNSNNISNKLKNTVQTITRNSEIVPSFVGITFNIHNGKTFLKLTVTEEMIGHKFGEFSPTRKKFSFKKNKN
uniref:Small ribosomal subunit protein uS19c n=1 Tax=Psammoneis japonica TaxID=517775 RepID=A0A2U9GJ00_9STRA|nr:ribosomal protein S19 [Psammoneis japonica]AWQ64253.1 ribosomal protein S19 [Psammoneis japonica]